jgi:hypothetical protein
MLKTDAAPMSTRKLHRESASEGRDRRVEERIPYQILMTTVAPGDGSGRSSPRMLPAWSIDVSRSGAAIVSREELPSQRVYLRFLLAGKGTRCVEGEVMNAAVADEFMGERGTFYRYGVRFVRNVTEAELQFALAETDHPSA